MIQINCDWCGKKCDIICYSVVSITVRDNRPVNTRSEEHVHYDCLPSWVSYMHGGPVPPWKEKNDTDDSESGRRNPETVTPA